MKMRKRVKLWWKVLTILFTHNVSSINFGASISRGAVNICGASLNKFVAVQMNPFAFVNYKKKNHWFNKHNY